MGFQWQLAIHLFLTAVVVVSFLCGHWPIFEGTPIEKIHYFINVAARNYLLKAAEAICGTKGRLLFLTIEHYCCERPNPILQILYLMTIGITYFLAWKSALPFIPGYYVSEKHWYVSVIGVFMGILLFIITSVSDPGTINSNNATNYLAAYPFDCIIYTTKQCSTCNIPRPARSKHCSICNRCVARFDHHCGWMNNCIGERNLRYFLAFLFWHTILCFYGSAVLVAILLGEWKEQRVARILTVYYGVENSFTKLAPHFIQWAMGFYSTQFLLLTFLALLSLLLAGFFSYHVYLVITNMTTNETFKWDNYKMWHLSVAHAKEVTECHDCTTDTTIVQDGRRDLNAVKSKHNFLNCNIHWKKFYSKWLRNTNCSLPDNAYDKGLMLNIYEVFFPLSTRKSFNSTKID